MAKKMLIDATHPEETRVVVVDGAKVEEFDFESSNKRQISGNIYLAKVTRVEPSLQAAFVEYGGNRHGFLAFSEIHPDYYQIPVADREALLAAEAADAAEDDEPEAKPKTRTRSRSRKRDKPAKPATDADASTAPAGAARDPDPVDAAAAESAADAPTPVEAASAQLETAETAPAGEDGAPRSIAESAGSDDAERVSAPVEADADAKPADAPEARDADAPEARDLEAAADVQAGDVTNDESAAPAAAKLDAAPAAVDDAASAAAQDDARPAATEAEPAAAETEARPAPKKRSRSRSRRKSAEPKDAASETAPSDATEESAPGAEGGDDGEVEADGVESVGAVSAREEAPRRKPRMRNYKIQEVIKVRQIMLVQVVKEERGNKGAALTTYLSLAGRYCVLMPNTARGGGISRKITSADDRKKLKEIAGEFEVPQGMGLIIRTAGAKRTRAEIRRDYEYLLRQWEEIRGHTLESVAPALIYEEGSLIKRSIRDLYSKDIDEVLVEGDDGYREAKEYMRMLMPSHAKNVKLHKELAPVFIKHQVESQLSAMFNPTVQLKSGGYIVIGITEALVAIDVNSGKSTREGSIEDTALKTNLEAADEVARQLRLRDLAGLIVIDFIDMDERRNNNAVEKRMKDRLSSDRARIQVGRISAFGLMEMSRQRLRPGMLEASTAPCPHCHGTGLVRSEDSLALSILRSVEEDGVRGKSIALTVTCPVSIANYIMNHKRDYLLGMQARYGMTVHILGDPALLSPDFKVEKTKGAPQRAAAAAPVAAASGVIDVEPIEVEEDEEAAAEEARPPRRAEEDGEGKNRRRRGKRGGRRRRREDEGEGEEDAAASGAPAGMEVIETPTEDAAPTVDALGEGDGAVPSKRRRRRRKPADDAAATPTEAATDAQEATSAAEPEADAVVAATAPADAAEVEAAGVEVAQVEAAQGEAASPDPAPESPAEPAAATNGAAEPEPALATADAAPAAAEPAVPPKPKRRGWWNLGRG